NKTTGKMAEYVVPNPDGSFSALLPMNEGKNTVEVYARSTDGTDGRREVTVSFLPGASTQELSPRQVAMRNRLLENRLLDLQRRNIEIQAEAKEDMRRELQVEIEKERKAAEESAAKVRKDVQISVEKKAQTEPPPSEPTSSGN